jgi:hypothetical protein
MEENLTPVALPCGHGPHMCAACVRTLVRCAEPTKPATCPLCRAEIPRGAVAAPSAAAATAAGLARSFSVRFLATSEDERLLGRVTDASPLLAQRSRGAAHRAAASASLTRERSMHRLALAAVPGRDAAAAIERGQFLRRVAEDEARVAAAADQSFRRCAATCIFTFLIGFLLFLLVILNLLR